MAVVVVLTHRVHIGGGLPTAGRKRRLPYSAECMCGWRLGKLDAGEVHDAAHLHYAAEGDTAIAYRLPVADEEPEHEWPLCNVPALVYEPSRFLNDSVIAG